MMFTSREGKAMNIRLQKHSLNSLIWHIKGKTKQATDEKEFSQSCANTNLA